MRPYVLPLELLLRSMGHWPFLTTRTLVTMRTLYVICLLSQAIPLFICAYKARHDFNYLLECLPFFINSAVMVWVYFYFFIIKRGILCVLFNSISRDFEAMKRLAEEFEILKEASAKGRFVILCYLGYMLMSIVGYCGMTLVPELLNIYFPRNESRPRYYVNEIDYVIFDRDDYYFSSFWHVSIVGSYCLCHIIAWDVMLCYFVQHAVGMFRILRYKLLNITQSVVDDNPTHSFAEVDDMFKRAADCVNVYKNILEFSDNINECYSILLLIYVGINVVILSFQGAMMLYKLDDTEFVIRYAMFAIGLSIHLLFNSYIGQQLVDASNDATNDIYDVKWYLATKKIQTILCIMMMRSLQLSQVSIGKMMVLCLETYAAIMKTIFSYLSVISTTVRQ